MLRGAHAAQEEFGNGVRNSDFGNRFAAGTWLHLPPADLYDFAMPVSYEAARLVIR